MSPNVGRRLTTLGWKIIKNHSPLPNPGAGENRVERHGRRSIIVEQRVLSRRVHRISFALAPESRPTNERCWEIAEFS